MRKTLYKIPWLGARLPYSQYIRWLSSFGLHKVHAIVLDHALTPVSHYLSRSDCEDLVKSAGWNIAEIVHNRSMSWGFCARRSAGGKSGLANGASNAAVPDPERDPLNGLSRFGDGRAVVRGP